VVHRCDNELAFNDGFTGCGKTTILGGAAVYRCDKQPVFNAALAAEATPSDFFRNLFSR